MKNQYFGDVNDYLKYALLRQLLENDIDITLCWMLTPNDRRPDGQKLKYLKDPDTWRQRDPQLFDFLRDCIEAEKRDVRVIEESNLLPNCRFHSEVLTDNATGRAEYFGRLMETAKGTDLIFFDTDNGLEVKSVKYGRKHSSKYLYFHEVKQCWNAGLSLCVFQFFPRVNHSQYINLREKALAKVCARSTIRTLQTPDVAYMFAIQKKHKIISYIIRAPRIQIP